MCKNVSVRELEQSKRIKKTHKGTEKNYLCRFLEREAAVKGAKKRKKNKKHIFI